MTTCEKMLMIFFRSIELEVVETLTGKRPSTTLGVNIVERPSFE
jgi:hypothetical protein